VLYRSNAQSRVIETRCSMPACPTACTAACAFFERAEIKHALAYLRLLENPNDDTSFLRVVNFPPRGIGARSLEQLQDAARATGCSLHDAVSAVPGKAGANLGAFVAKHRRAARADPGLTLREIIELVLDHSGLIEHYRPSAKAPTASRTWRNWSTRPRALSRRRALAAMRWRCRWTSWASR
jgi:DNA helicase-2/ATP-dependent DNA helicase PcrA